MAQNFNVMIIEQIPNSSFLCMICMTIYCGVFQQKKETMQKGRKVEGCCRAWGVLLGAISMYKGWSFSNKREAGKQKVGKV